MNIKASNNGMAIKMMRCLLLSALCFNPMVVSFTQPLMAAYQRRRIKSALGSKTSPSVLCIGDALLDCIANEDARGFTVDEMVSNHAWTAWPGGAPANVATTLCKLGTTSAYAGCVGQDQDGDDIQSLLENIGVDVTLLRRTADHPTRRVMVTRDSSGDRAFAGFYEGRSAGAFADAYFDMTTVQDAPSEAIIKGAEWLVCSTLSLAFEHSAEAVNHLVDRGLAGGARLCVDVNWRNVFWSNEQVAREAILVFAQRADVVKLTDEEAMWLLGIPSALACPQDVSKAFPRAFAVLVTAGEKGASYCIFDHCGKIEPFQVDVKETTGAGDAFTAGFLHALLSLQDDTLKEEPRVAENMVRFAAAVGALTCTSEGAIAAQPTMNEVESFLIHGQKVWA